MTMLLRSLLTLDPAKAPSGREQHWVALLAKAKLIGSAAVKCSNQADLHLTSIDRI